MQIFISSGVEIRPRPISHMCMCGSVAVLDAFRFFVVLVWVAVSFFDHPADELHKDSAHHASTVFPYGSCVNLTLLRSQPSARWRVLRLPWQRERRLPLASSPTNEKPTLRRFPQDLVQVPFTLPVWALVLFFFFFFLIVVSYPRRRAWNSVVVACCFFTFFRCGDRRAACTDTRQG